MSGVIEFGMRVSDAFNTIHLLRESMLYVRAKNNHIICNYIPVGDEMFDIHIGHRVHLFINDLNVINATVVLANCIKTMYQRTGKRVIIHIPISSRSREILFDLVNDILHIHNKDIKGMYKLYRMQSPTISFVYSTIRNDLSTVQKFADISYNKDKVVWTITSNASSRTLID